MQIVGEKAVRVVPNVAVSGNGASMGLAEGLLGLLVRGQPAAVVAVRLPPRTDANSLTQLQGAGPLRRLRPAIIER